MNRVYGLFGFDFQLELSTRPEKRLGSDEIWDKSESVRSFSFEVTVLFLSDFRPRRCCQPH